MCASRRFALSAFARDGTHHQTVIPPGQVEGRGGGPVLIAREPYERKLTFSLALQESVVELTALRRDAT